MTARAMKGEPPADDDRAREDRERFDRIRSANATSSEGDLRHRDAMTAIRTILTSRTAR